MKSINKLHKQNRNKFIIVLLLLVLFIGFTIWFIYFIFKPEKYYKSFFDENRLTMNQYVDLYGEEIWNNNKSLAIHYINDYASWLTTLNLIDNNQLQINSFKENESIFIEHGFYNGFMTYEQYLDFNNLSSYDEFKIENIILYVDIDFTNLDQNECYNLTQDVEIINSIVLFKNKVNYNFGSQYELKIINSFVYNLNVSVESLYSNSFLIENSYLYCDKFELTLDLFENIDNYVYNSLVSAEYIFENNYATSGEIINDKKEISYFDLI